MVHQRVCWILLIPTTCTISLEAARAQNPEFRAMWVSRFEWPNTNPATCQATINNIMQTLAAHHFNAVLFQIRGQADVLYPSPYEVWSPLIGGSNPGWDPLAYAINAAHANGIEFHAYINTHTCWQSAAHLPPTNPNHLFFAHTDASNPNARDWLIHDAAGNPVQWSEDNYVWLAPGVPAYQAYIRQQILYVVQNYDVDGVHFDRIRTPNSSYSYDPISQARRLNPQSNPNNLDFSHWTRDQITRNVRDAYADIMVIKPWVKVSAAVFPDSTTAPANQ
ncbi:MAG TPA: family 10 glycosylhydrolase, partial [Phycisphaerae bacterium]